MPTGTTKFRNLIDDDVKDNGIQSKIMGDDMEIDTTLWESRLKPAFIRIDYRESIAYPPDDAYISTVNNVNEDDLEFKFHLAGFDDLVGHSDQNMIDGLGEIHCRHRQSRDTQEFWAVYMIGVHQISVKGDGDHIIATPGANSAGSVSYHLGKTVAYGLGDKMALVAAETVRDFYQLAATPGGVSEQNFRALVSLHELGHIAGLKHEAWVHPLIDGDGRIMDYGSLNAAIDLNIYFDSPPWPMSYPHPELNEMRFSDSAFRKIVQNRGGFSHFEF